MKNDEILVAVSSEKRLIVEPIWLNPVDDIEGPLYLEYIKNNPKYDKVYLRETVYKMLKKASEVLPDDFALILRAGHRPLEVQIKLLNMVMQQYLENNPNSTDKEAMIYARIFVSDPKIKIPPHCCGSAVDVDVVNKKTQQLVDFGCPVNTDSEIAYLNTGLINKDQQKNRKMLLNTMIKSGFAPFESEWWHYSFGDQVWASYYKKDKILYNTIEPTFS